MEGIFVDEIDSAKACIIQRIFQSIEITEKVGRVGPVEVRKRDLAVDGHDAVTHHDVVARPDGL